MTKTMTATESRIHLGGLMDDVETEREHILVVREGTAIAVAVPIGQYNDDPGVSTMPDWFERAKRSSEMVAKWLNGRPLPDIDEMINFGHDVD